MRKPIVFAAAIVLIFSLGIFIVGNRASSVGSNSLESQSKERERLLGAVIPLGGYNWRVLDVQDGKALIITENIVEQRSYSVKLTQLTWETCTLRDYLNGEFLQKFTAEEQGRITETRVSNAVNLWYGTKGGNDTTDKVFLLSLEEVDKYFGDSGDYQEKRRKEYNNHNRKWVEADNGYGFSNANDGNRIAKYNDGASFWWLRSPGHDSFTAAHVDVDGSVYVVDGFPVYIDGGVRPALWLNL